MSLADFIRTAGRSTLRGMSQELASLVATHYEDLRLIARREHYRFRQGSTAGPSATSLLGEATLRLMRQRSVPANREQFLGIATLLLRRAAMARARFSTAIKRSAERTSNLRSEPEAAGATGTPDQADIHAALDRLQMEQPRQAEILALSAAFGLSNGNIATLLSVSVATVERDLRSARQTLAARLGLHGEPER